MSDEGFYILRNLGAEEFARLDIQHIWISAAAFGGKLLADEVIEDTLPRSIADVCCGTGIWLSDVRRKYYEDVDFNARLVGLDITDKGFPDPLPPGIELYQCDCTSSVPDTLCGQFDLVNLRLIWAAIPADKAARLIANCLRLLKPGGYFQWVDAEFRDAIILPRSAISDFGLDFINEDRKSRGLILHIPSFTLRTFLDLEGTREAQILRYDRLHDIPKRIKMVLGAPGLKIWVAAALQVLDFFMSAAIAEGGRSEHEIEKFRAVKKFSKEKTDNPGDLFIDGSLTTLIVRKAGPSNPVV